ncbi:hypothetical protein CEV34_2730 [Brucella pseudogrignonensis]|uniref:Uncharacterized protein n=1 Tax=Brucella pseudogrignonensis TaxID=419475 RepID=A0A256GG46_9HYPH|nr:hypothetical protein CEV34_2730 [Brucella pseudogrignonensis]
MQQARKLQAACAKKEEFATYPVLMVAMEETLMSAAVCKASA